MLTGVRRLAETHNFAAPGRFCDSLGNDCEILKTIADRDADADAGYRTLGTRLADREAKLAYVLVAASVVAAAIAPCFVGLASTTYLIVVMPATVVPTAGVIVLLYRWPRN